MKHRYLLRDTWYIYMDDLSFQEPIFYPRLLLISFDGDLKPISQATQHMYSAAYFKIMYIQNDSQGLIHVLGVREKIFNGCISQRLIEIWLFANEFQNRNFGQLRSSGGIKSVNKLFIKFLHFIDIPN